MTPCLSVVGDVTGLLSGDNSYSPLTGELVRQMVWGAGLRYTLSRGAHEMSVEVGATNGLGSSTGLSMTPGLGGSTSVYAALSYRK